MSYDTDAYYAIRTNEADDWEPGLPMDEAGSEWMILGTKQLIPLCSVVEVGRRLELGPVVDNSERDE